MDKEALIHVLRSEVKLSVGCTDLGAVCLAVNRAVRELGRKPDRIAVEVSPNVYKNGINVGVPGTGMRGLHVAAALGAVVEAENANLTLLQHASEKSVQKAVELITRSAVSVDYIETHHPLYIKATVMAGDNSAHALIINDYASFDEVVINDRIIEWTDDRIAIEARDELKNYSLKKLFEMVEELSIEDLRFLSDAAEVNRSAAISGLASPGLHLGTALREICCGLPGPYASAALAQMMTAAACEARMSGLNVPVSSVTGSGNHGISCLLGVLAVAENLDSPVERTARALAISTIVTIMIKEHSQKLSAFCGCAVASSAGIAAATVYLLGGGHEDSIHAIQTVIGTLAGMVCDGAKESCAYKLSASASLAVQYGYMAMNGTYIPARMGILSETIEGTFHNLGLLNYPGMVETDRVLLNMIKDNLA
ncbi:MAG TPA: L-serine ammonia-lyase, iron-sulfur-dependent, subunit alpha [Methanocella sp.]|nr:L-serine ammonia-lyase, iron-sulfur-dependent, subunit alpha [Methanocella sp.]